ncbi:hypothetical protein GF389_04050 [Candidatus Dojkabacteria bacterium]|nr:hypothetical protein [Candidatus Dojkabacteria bacterium]
MKKFILTILLFVSLANFVVLQYPHSVKASDRSKIVNVYLFHSDSCLHCKQEKEFLDEMSQEEKNKYNLYEFEVGQYQELFREVADTLDENSLYVPYLVIGDEVIIGFGDEETTGVEIKDRIDYCFKNICSDSVFELVDPDAKEKTYLQGSNENVAIDNSKSQQVYQEEQSEKGYEDKELVKLPLAGEVVDLKNFSLPVAAVILGFVDGFNPCAMWVLFFLITLLIKVESFWKRIYLGTLFILASGIVYFAALLGWNLVFTFIHNIIWIKLLVVVVALFSGINLLRKFFQKEDTCKVVKEEQRDSVFSRLRKVVDSRNLIYASVMLIVVAFSVNLIELACSIGLPVVFADLIEEHGVGLVEKLGLISLYILFYMLDDLAIFVVSMITLESMGLSNRYLRFVYLIGGIVMFLIALNLIMGL